MSNPDDPRTWLAKADNDLLNIRNNLDAVAVPWDTLCFHAQQAAEKALKGFLVSRNAEFVRTHDLIALLAQAIEAGGALSELERHCRVLIPYAVELRYPGVGDDPTEADAREAIIAAETICATIKSSLRLG